MSDWGIFLFGLWLAVGLFLLGNGIENGFKAIANAIKEINVENDE